jgi:hypothetical protein
MERLAVTLLEQTFLLAGCKVMTGALTIALAVTWMLASSALAAVIVQVPAVLGAVHELPVKEPQLALQLMLLVAPCEAVELKLTTAPPATVPFAGVIAVRVTVCGVTSTAESVLSPAALVARRQ